MTSIDSNLVQSLAQAALSDFRQTRQPAAASTAPPAFGAYHRAASVLSAYDPELLRPAPPVDTSDLDELLVDSEPIRGSAAPANWALLSEVRRNVFRAMGSREELLHALEVNAHAKPHDATQRMLEAHLAGSLPGLEEQGGEEVAATFQVVKWFDGLPGDLAEGLPGREAIQRRSDYLALLQPFRDLAGDHFAGRIEELRWLRAHVGVLDPGGSTRQPRAADIHDIREKPPLVIWGIGGVGKSALVAQFISEHAAAAEAHRFPWTYLDLDRPSLLPEEPLTLLIEAVRQIGLQYPDSYHRAELLRANWETQLRRQGLGGDASGGMKVGRGRSNASTWASYLRDFQNLITSLDAQDAPYLFVLDTFEEAQYLGEAIVDGLGRFLAAFQEHVPRLRAVIAGRAPVGGSLGIPAEERELGDFDEAAAVSYLSANGGMPEQTAQAIYRQVRGSPLSLRLAISVWQAEGKNPDGLADLEERHLFQFAILDNDIDGVLYTRILDHIKTADDDRVRKLAHPGLVLRRITPEVIQEVLAKAGGVQVADEPDARRLFAALQREVSLVRFDESGALRHRADVRRVMLRHLRATEPDLVRRIEEAAVAYYEPREDATARAEEIYHRLSLAHESVRVEERWQDALARGWFAALRHALAGAWDDLDIGQRVWLKEKLGQPLLPAEREAADLVSWEHDTARTVAALLERDLREEALQALRGRPQRSDSSVLRSLEAEALQRLGRLNEARDVVRDGFGPAAADSNRPLAIDLRVQAAGIALARDDAAEALALLDEAVQIACGRKGYDVRLARADLIRWSVLEREPGAGDRDALRAALHARFDALTDEQLAAEQALAFRFAAAIGSGNPAVLHRVVRLAGIGAPVQTRLRRLGRALAAWDGERAGSEGALAKAAGLPPGAASEAWVDLLIARSPSDVSRLIERLLTVDAEPPYGVRTALTEIFAAAGEERSAHRAAEPAPPVTPSEQTARLTGPQLLMLRDALLDAFPSYEDLATVVRFRLDQNLEAIVGPDQPLPHAAFQVIQNAQRQGWLLQLVDAARSSRPDNIPLAKAAAMLGLTRAADPYPTDEDESPELRWRLDALAPQICVISAGFDSGPPLAVGSLVGPRAILTTGAVVQAIDAGQVRVVDVRLTFDRHQTADGALVNAGVEFFLADDWLIDVSNAVDGDGHGYAVVRASGAAGYEPIGNIAAEAAAATRGWIEIETDTPPPPPGARLLVPHLTAAGSLHVVPCVVTEIGPEALRLRRRPSLTASEDWSLAGAPCFDESWRLVAMTNAPHEAADQTVIEAVLVAAVRQHLDAEGMASALESEFA